VDGGPPPEDAALDKLGAYFAFTNREAQCKDLLRAFAAMDEKRGNGEMDVTKRDVFVPVCTGMPGIGKTRFARAAITSLALHALHRQGGAAASAAAPWPSYEKALDAAAALVQDVWPDAPSEEQRAKEPLVRQLLLACRDNRNIRLQLPAWCKNLEHEIGVHILAEWAKHRPRRDGDASLDAFADRLRSTLFTQLARAGVTLTALGAIEFILATVTVPVRDEGEEAAGSGSGGAAGGGGDAASPATIDALVKPLVTANARVFITITGLSSAQVSRAIKASSAKPCDIVLPLLTNEHMASILATLFTQPLPMPPSIRCALWWLGGGPRFLEYLLAQAAVKARAPTVTGLWAWLGTTADMDDTMGAVRLAHHQAYQFLLRPGARRLPDDVLDNVFSLAVAERRVALECVLHDGNPVWTVQLAQDNQVVYWEGSPGGNGILRMPPLLLFAAYERAGPPSGAPVVPLKRPSAAMTPGDVESLAVATFMHKLRAAAIDKQASVMLSEIVGELGDVPDVQLPVPRCFDLRVCEQPVSADNLPGFLSTCRAELRASPATTACAVINARRAEFVDAFIVFPDFAIFVQEQQSADARPERELGHTARVPPMPADGAVSEYHKHGERLGPHVFLYVTDCRAREQEIGLAQVPQNTILVTHEKHDAVLGALAAGVRRWALCPTA
jgi:hypothetical protein